MERFWSKVQRTNDCWIWTAGVDKDGYGRFRLGKVKARANRVAWELIFGPIPDGHVVCHSCDNPPCVRPDHLFLGTTQDNNSDRDAKGRTARIPQKLTPELVEEIRASYVPGVVRQQDLADTYGVSQVMISRIVRNKNWKPEDVQDDPTVPENQEAPRMGEDSAVRNEG